MGEVEVTPRDGTIGVFENFRFCDSDGEKRGRRSSLGILLRFADAAGLVRSLGDAGRGAEKHPLWSPRRGERQSSVVFERSAVTDDRVWLVLIAFRRALSRGARRELAGTRRFRRSRWGREGRTGGARRRGVRRRETPSTVTVERWRRDALVDRV